MVSTSKNTLYLFTANIYQKFISLIYLFLLARFLGVENFGKYSFAFSFVIMFSIFLDLGLSTVLTREVARDEAKAKNYLNNIFSLKFFTSLIVFFLVFFLINLSGYPSLTKNFVYLAALIMILDSFSFSLYQVFRGYLNLKFEGIGIIVNRTISFIIGLIFIFLKLPPILIILPILFGSIFYFLNALFFLKKRIGLSLSFSFDKPLIKFLFGLSLPFFIAGIFSQLFGTVDTVLLSFLKGDRAVGLYTSAQKVVVAAGTLIGGSLAGALYPAFSYYFVRDKKQLSSLFNKTVFYLALIFLPSVFGILLLARPLIFFVYGKEYLEAVKTLKIISLSLPFMFLDYLILCLLNACEKQKANTVNRGIAAFVLIISNLILIPLFSYLGSAIACILGFSVLFLLGTYYSLKIVKIDKKYLMGKIFGILFATLIMSIFIFFLRDKLQIMLLIGLAAILYLSILYFFKILGREEVNMLKEIFKNSRFNSLIRNNS
ncbi:hypothetical protein COS23_01945 [bacterium (Candidatus Moisslbacteria) CG02_land_8_20_14_3_00_36_53]|nr:flippase [Candidatus Kuenenbacteria bacterium]OIP76886.1 MAG: hypothetical protein AUK09_00835 [Parcubacteria group bacterium CG2_30_36_38]PIV45912.1 MAG: hypothetical protein COS23_01945 [bacterium (Candidatus Moisslbacteria) CG02_land_8_20_14_3_00_36_53]PIZ90170.1 MAG: hypothetical protein COX87_01980 [bacterium (Candidatus Moisslbacteria) CG_4_10_14_0_2_um_filter_36_61]